MIANPYLLSLSISVGTPKHVDKRAMSNKKENNLMQRIIAIPLESNEDSP